MQQHSGGLPEWHLSIVVGGELDACRNTDVAAFAHPADGGAPIRSRDHRPGRDQPSLTDAGRKGGDIDGHVSHSRRNSSRRTISELGARDHGSSCGSTRVGCSVGLDRVS
jgi:hypothetical protein